LFFPQPEQFTNFLPFACLQPNGFSGTAIRNAFLRFFVTIFNRYEQYLTKGSEGNLFRSNDFLLSLNLPPGSQGFVARVIASQMFQAFVQERKANPTSPSILLFDESIIAKNNRSRKTTLTSGGKHKTPFLDDTSGEVRGLYPWRFYSVVIFLLSTSIFLPTYV
jgi:hypothetical protein